MNDEDGSEIISVIADSDFEDDTNSDYPTNLPLLPLRNTVLFPGIVFPITVGRDKSIKLIQDSYKKDKITIDKKLNSCKSIIILNTDIPIFYKDLAKTLINEYEKTEKLEDILYVL